MNNILISTLATATIMLTNLGGGQTSKPLAQVSYSLANRYADSFVNSVFSDNILLTVAYLGQKVKTGDSVSWNKVQEEGATVVTLDPGQTFAFHDAVLDKYKSKVTMTTNAHFSADEGFKSDGWLIGDGVCHLASFMYVAAKNAGLETEAPTSHDFAAIPDVEKKDGVSIFSQNSQQNLYITNNQKNPVNFVFEYKAKALTIRVEELI